MPVHGKGSMDAAFARRRRYIEMRLAGVSMWDAGTQLGLDPYGTILKYEHWYEAVRDGKIPMPPSRAHPGKDYP